MSPSSKPAYILSPLKQKHVTYILFFYFFRAPGVFKMCSGA